MDDPAWYADWRHEAVHLLQDKNEALRKEFKLGDWPRWDYDLEDNRISFSENGDPKVVADIQVVGTTSENAGNWLWGWANSHWPSSSVEDSERVCAFGEEHGIRELTSGFVEDDDLNALGWELTAVAARVNGSVGAYRPGRDEGGSLFLLYRKIWWVT